MLGFTGRSLSDYASVEQGPSSTIAILISLLAWVPDGLNLSSSMCAGKVRFSDALGSRIDRSSHADLNLPSTLKRRRIFYGLTVLCQLSPVVVVMPSSMSDG